LAAVMLVASSTASADTFTVTRHNDPHPNGCKPQDCSLREAVIKANAHGGHDTIVLPDAATYALTIVGSDDNAQAGDLDVTDALTIRHPGAGLATVDATTAHDGVIQNIAGGPLTVSHLDLTGGNPGLAGGAINAGDDLKVLSSVLEKNGTGAGGVELGGALQLAGDGATFVVRDSTIRGNHARVGGGIQMGTAGAPGKLTVVGSRIQGNTAAGTSPEGGGIEVGVGSVLVKNSTIAKNRAKLDAFAAGGGIAAESDVNLKVKTSTIADNHAVNDGGGLYLLPGQTQILRSTISGNRSKRNGGGISSSSTLSVIDSTLFGNRAAGSGGALFEEGGPMVMNSATIVGNEANSDSTGSDTGGGMSRSGGTAFIEDSLIALNTLGPTTPDDCEFFDSASVGHNLTSSDCHFASTADTVDAHPRLGPLADNGGPTETVALEKGSPAIGGATGGDATPRDQRGHKRDAHPDVGAFER
jgi:hypothetical protein